jgi:hypothetical protein
MRGRVTVDNKHRDRHEKGFKESPARGLWACAFSVGQFFSVYSLSFLTPLLDVKLLRDHNNEHKVFNRDPS